MIQCNTSIYLFLRIQIEMRLFRSITSSQAQQNQQQIYSVEIVESINQPAGLPVIFF